MKLSDLLNNDQLILVVCDDCGGKTPVDPAPYALQTGLGTELSTLAAEINCPVCGSAEIALRAHSPVQRRTETPALAK